MPLYDRNDREIGRTGLARTRWMRGACGIALATLVVCANTAAARAGDGDEEDDVGNSVASKIMRTLGLKDPRNPEYGIDYSERSPLVVPPTRDLPPPVTTGALPAPNWPKDADVKRRVESKKQKKEGRYVDPMEEARPLRPEDLNKVSSSPAPASGPQPGATSQPGQNTPDPAAKKSIFSLDWFKKEQYATFTGEPARTSLTEPPPGYQTPSPDQPYGIGPDKKPYKVPTLTDRMEAPR